MIPSAPLEAEIQKLIVRTGPIPVSRYMEICLAHSEYGYYMSRDPFGREGDFITAPEVSQMFGELLGLWAASVWRAMGSPSGIRLIELGPGRGTMMMDAIRALRVVPDFVQAMTIHLVEISPALREKQRKNLSALESKITWHESFDDLPDGPAIVLANEYFDALPVHQVVRMDDGWHERVVQLDRDRRLKFSTAPALMPHFEVLVPPVVRAAPVGSIFEWRSNFEVMKLAHRLKRQGGAALIIDYGHTRSDAGDTFQAIARHSFSDPLKTPGLADLTAHVDFQALARSAEDAGAQTFGPVEQGHFLTELGIEARAATLINKAEPSVAADVTGALKRLTGTGRGCMGSLFKVLGVAAPEIGDLPGFSGRSATKASLE